MTLEPHLRDLYKISIEEDRYQVQLNWDKTKFLLLLNTSLVAAATALFSRSGGRIASLLVLLTFAAGAVVAAVGIVSLGEGKQYHRRAVAKSVIIGNALGLTDGIDPHSDFTLQLVSGMKTTKAQEILSNPEEYVTPKLRRFSVSQGINFAFVVLIVLDFAGILIAGYSAAGCPLGGC